VFSVLNEKIKIARVLIKMTQAKFAEKVGRSRVTIGRWESGEREPSAGEMSSIAATLDTSVAYLMGETEDPRRNLEQQNVNATANRESSTATAIGIDGQNTINLVSPEAKTNVTNEGEGIIFEFEPGKRIVFPKGTPQKVISATIETVLKNGEIWHRSSPQPPLAT
jgi:transcriptional regulator with XRE-family HTH domain